MSHFWANLVVSFIPFRKIRRKVRNKIMIKKVPLHEQQKKYNELKSQWLVHNNGNLLLPARFTEYDLIIPIGATCHISWLLAAFQLRSFSMPFEWTGGMEPANWYINPLVQRDTRFREKIDAVCNDFKDFYNPGDFMQLTDCNPKKEHHMVVNIKTKIRFMHAFPADRSFESYVPEFVNKMTRRSIRLKKYIEKSQKILICWLHKTWEQKAFMDATVSDQDIKYAVKMLKNKYPDKEFDFVFFEHDGKKGRFEFDKISVTPNAFRVRSNHFLVDNEYGFLWRFYHEAHSHIHVVSEMLDNIKLSRKQQVIIDK